MTNHRPHPSPRLYDGDRMLASRQLVAAQARRHVAQVTRRCEPIACDVATKTPLYDWDQAVETLLTRRRVA